MEGNRGIVTADDFTDFMNLLYMKSENRTWVAYTGQGGYFIFRLKISWETYGKRKLPRKLKKIVYMTKKIRKKYLPEYYKSQIHDKQQH